MTTWAVQFAKGAGDVWIVADSKRPTKAEAAAVLEAVLEKGARVVKFEGGAIGHQLNPEGFTIVKVPS